MKKTNYNIQGFTLIELLLILSIFSIMLLIIYPKINTNRFQLLAYSKELCSDIRNVKMLNMTSGNSYRIILTSHTYTVNEGAKELKKVIMQGNIKLLYDNNEIRFNYNGAPVHGGTTITIFDEITGKSYKITIIPSSGRILLIE